MSSSEALLGCCGACGLLAAYICWLVYGGLALHDSLSYAQGCGWMLWVTTLVELIYVPFGAALSAIAIWISGIALFAPADDDNGTGNDFIDGCLGTCMITCMNLLNGTFIALGYFSLWKEECIPHHLTVVTFARVSFYLCAVLTGLSLLIAAAAWVKHTCGA